MDHRLANTGVVCEAAVGVGRLVVLVASLYVHVSLVEPAMKHRRLAAKLVITDGDVEVAQVPAAAIPDGRQAGQVEPV